MSAIHFIDTKALDLTKIKEIITENQQLELSVSAIEKINECRLFLDEKTK